MPNPLDQIFGSLKKDIDRLTRLTRNLPRPPRPETLLARLPREIKPPRPVETLMARLPTKFPLEAQADKVIDRVGESLAASAPVKEMERIQAALPKIPEMNLNTPFGRVRTPEVSVPRIIPTRMDSRRKEALKTAIAIDISSLVGMIPVVGDVASDVIEDTFGAKLRKTLTDPERQWYMRYDKLGPSTLGLLRAFSKVRR